MVPTRRPTDCEKMNRRPKPAAGSQRLPARHDLPTTRAKTTKAKDARAPPGAHAGALGPPASRTKKETNSLRAACSQLQKEVQKNQNQNHHGIAKSHSVLNATTATNRSRIDSKKPRKVPLESEAFFTNLLLLGFKPDVASAKNRGTSIPFDKDMFQVPNMLAFQVVMHFLFNKLDQTKFQDEFRDCWPICDRKQEQAFRKLCMSWLTEISEQDDAHLPRLVPSLFLSPGGTRFYQLMLSLTRFILTKLIAKKNLKIQYPQLTPKNTHMSDLLARTIKELVARRRSNFFSSIQQSMIVNRECEQFAGDLVKEYRSLNDEIREKERILENLRMDLDEKAPLSPRGLDSVSFSRDQKVEKIRDQWSKVETYYHNSRKEREIVSSIIKGTIDKHRLLASDYDVQVPDLLLRTRNEDIQKRDIANTVEGGKLNLISVLKLWTLSMDVCQNQSSEKTLPNLQHFAPNLLRYVGDITAYLANLRSLKNKIHEIDLPEVRRSVKELKESDERKTPGKFWHGGQNELGFIPPTPPVSFEPSAVEDTTILPYIKGKTPRKIGTTPEAAMRIVESVQKKARKKETGDVSKLPKRMEAEASEMSAENVENGVLGRIRQNSGGVSDRISTPTRPRVMNHVTGQQTMSKEPISNVTNKMPVLKPPPGLKNVEKMHSENPTKPVIRSAIPKPAVEKSRPAISEKENYLLEVTISQPKEAVAKKREEPKKRVVSKELFTSPPKSSKERAEDDLIDQMVNVITSASPHEKAAVSAESTPGSDTSVANLLDPLEALDDAPFQKRDKIANSPVGSSPALTKGKRTVTFSPGTRVSPTDVEKFKTPLKTGVGLENLGFEENDVIMDSPLHTVMKSPYNDVTMQSPFHEQTINTSYDNDVTMMTPYSEKKAPKSPYNHVIMTSPFVDARSSPYTESRRSPYTDARKSPYSELGRKSPFGDKGRKSPFTDRGRRSPFADMGRKSPYGVSMETPGSPVIDVIRHESPASRSPVPRIFLSPLPEFDAPIDLPSLGSADMIVNPVHEPSPARLEAMRNSPKPGAVTKSPVIASIPVLDLRAISPVDDVMDASLDLVDLSLESDDDDVGKEKGAVPTADLLGFDDPTPSVDPTQNANESSLVLGRLSTTDSPEREDAGNDEMEESVLNSDAKIEFLHQVEKSFEEEMLNLSLKVTGTPNYAKENKSASRSMNSNCNMSNSRQSLELNDENDIIGLPRTPISMEKSEKPKHLLTTETPKFLKFEISPNFTMNDSSPSPERCPASGDAALPSSKETSPLFSVLSPSTTKTDSTETRSSDIFSRFRSLKMRTQNTKSPETVVTPEEDRALDDVYLQQSPRHEPTNSGKFALDLDFDNIVNERMEDLNNNSCRDDEFFEANEFDDSEVVFRSPEKVVNPLRAAPASKQPSVRDGLDNFGGGVDTSGFLVNTSGLLDFGGEDILIQDSP